MIIEKETVKENNKITLYFSFFQSLLLIIYDVGLFCSVPHFLHLKYICNFVELAVKMDINGS